MLNKKIILSMVFVFALGAFTQINADEIENMKCAEDAFHLQGSLEAQGYDMEFANMVADVWYDACMEIMN
ncbi:MAG: hypothetical protein WAV86_06565 [Lutibacter sp.]